MAEVLGQGFGRRAEVRHQRMSEEVGGAVDDTSAELTRSTYSKAHRAVHGNAVLCRRHVFALRDGEQVQ